jgi:hypothetical protein
MEMLRFGICLVVGFLGLLAVLLGVVAEVKRVKVSKPTLQFVHLLFFGVISIFSWHTGS